MKTWSIAQLELWDESIFQKANKFGLSCHEQEFQVCDHNEMLGYLAYSGIPSHYPHWSYGKAYEKTKTLYDHGISGLPYEMVINSNPALAYLMRDNSLCLQIITMSHVYGHNDFFKNNFTFRSTHAEHILGTFKAYANIVRTFAEDPSIGFEAVELVLDAAHALSLQCRRNLGIRKLSVEDERKRLIDAAKPKEDPFHKLHKREEYVEPDLTKLPPSPDEDILLFVAGNNPFLKDWERTLLHIVHEEAKYFIPQIETKIMNEGWASFWHREILNALSEEGVLPQALHLEFLVRHNQVVKPHKNGLNPYHVGLKIWDDIRHRYDEAKIGKICEDHQEEYDRNGAPGDLGELTGLEKLFKVREVDRDTSFIRRNLSEYLIRELDLFEYKPKEEDLVVSEVADQSGWKKIKATLLRDIGMNSVPVIEVVDGNIGGSRELQLRHDHDGRDLLIEYARKTMEHLYFLWKGNIRLETNFKQEHKVFTWTDKGFGIKNIKVAS